VVTTSSAPIAASTLSDNPGHGLYDGIVRVACGAGTGPDAASVSALDDYAAAFGVRSACLFAHGDPTLGLATGRNVDTGTSPVMLQYTAQGTAVFGWYATNAPVEVSGVAAALAAPIDATTTPLLVDQSGNAAVAIHQFADGHELMLLTFDQAPGAPHSSQLLCGVASWLAHGVYLGEKARLPHATAGRPVHRHRPDRWKHVQAERRRSAEHRQLAAEGAGDAGGSDLSDHLSLRRCGGERQRRSDSGGAPDRPTVLLHQSHLQPRGW
jgi:hypothetical protein